MNIEKRLIDGNISFLNNEKYQSLRKELSNGQNPYCLVIACSDSRVVPEKIFNCSLGELFVIRTAGNVINEGELASIEYGIEHLHIKYVLVLGHTHCGAVHAAIHQEQGQYLSPIIDNIANNIHGIINEREASITNGIKQVEYIKSKFPHFDGEVKFALYDIETGEVIF